MSEKNSKIKVKASAEIVRQVVERMCNTKESATKILKCLNVSYWDFHEFLSENPLHAQTYERAQSTRAEAYADEIIEISDTENDSMKARNRIDSRKWYASKMNPKKYGDRIDLNVNQTIDIKSVLIEAEKRAGLLPSSDLENVKEAQHIDSTSTQSSHDSGYEPVEQPESGNANVKNKGNIFD